jgi:Na+/proline symporter
MNGKYFSIPIKKAVTLGLDKDNKATINKDKILRALCFFQEEEAQFFVRVASKDVTIVILRKKDTIKERFILSLPDKKKQIKKDDILKIVPAKGASRQFSEIKISFDKKISLVGEKGYLDVTAGKIGLALLGFIIGCLGIGLGYPGQPHVITRYMAARDDVRIRQGRIIALSWGVFVLCGASLLGLAARAFIPIESIVDPERSYPALITQYNLFPSILAGLLIAAIVSAMMSTADSQLLVVSSAVVRDIYQRILNTNATQNTLVFLSRVVVLLVGIGAVIAAMTKTQVVFWFVLFTWSGLGASFGPGVILGLFWKRLTRAGVIAGMIAGFGMTLLWKLWLKGVVADAIGMSLYELVPAFVLSFLLTVIVSLVTRVPERAGDKLAKSEGLK